MPTHNYGKISACFEASIHGRTAPSPLSSQLEAWNNVYERAIMKSQLSGIPVGIDGGTLVHEIYRSFQAVENDDVHAHDVQAYDIRP